MGQPFQQQLLVTESETQEEVTQAKVQEDQLIEDLVDLWEVLVTHYVQREAQENCF